MKTTKSFLSNYHNKVLVFILSLCILLSINVVPTYAYATLGCNIPNKKASFIWGDRVQGTGMIRSAWENAIKDWATASSANFYNSSSSVNSLNSFYESSTTLYGKTNYTYFGSKITSFTAMVNAGNFNMTTNVSRSTANHELGHVLGLDDIYSGTAIMNSNRNRSSLYLPQTDDKNGVKAIYGS